MIQYNNITRSNITIEQYNNVTIKQYNTIQYDVGHPVQEIEGSGTIISTYIIYGAQLFERNRLLVTNSNFQSLIS